MCVCLCKSQNENRAISPNVHVKNICLVALNTLNRTLAACCCQRHSTFSTERRKFTLAVVLFYISICSEAISCTRFHLLLVSFFLFVVYVFGSVIRMCGKRVSCQLKVTFSTFTLPTRWCTHTQFRAIHSSFTAIFASPKLH